jgi:hypothetical protein
MIEQEKLEHELLGEVMGLMEKSELNELTPLPISMDSSEGHALESSLITIRNLNARYDRQEAIAQIRGLIRRYKIQLDELMNGSGGV